MARTITITVAPDGTVKVRTAGYAGPACLEAARGLEAAMGVVGPMERTAEYYQAAEEPATTETRRTQG